MEAAGQSGAEQSVLLGAGLLTCIHTGTWSSGQIFTPGCSQTPSHQNFANNRGT